MRTKLIIGLMAVAVGLTACNKTKTEEPVPAEEMLTPGERVVEGVSQLEVSHTRDTVTWHGKVYRDDIVREPDDSLPKVKMDETGTLFTDNHIDVKVTCEGKQVFSRRFYKSSFNSYLPEDFRSQLVDATAQFMTRDDMRSLVSVKAISDSLLADSTAYVMLRLNFNDSTSEQIELPLVLLEEGWKMWTP